MADLKDGTVIPITQVAPAQQSQNTGIAEGTLVPITDANKDSVVLGSDSKYVPAIDMDVKSPTTAPGGDKDGPGFWSRVGDFFNNDSSDRNPIWQLAMAGANPFWKGRDKDPIESDTSTDPKVIKQRQAMANLLKPSSTSKPIEPFEALYNFNHVDAQGTEDKIPGTNYETGAYQQTIKDLKELGIDYAPNPKTGKMELMPVGKPQLNFGQIATKLTDMTDAFTDRKNELDKELKGGNILDPSNPAHKTSDQVKDLAKRLDNINKVQEDVTNLYRQVAMRQTYKGEQPEYRSVETWMQNLDDKKSADWKGLTNQIQVSIPQLDSYNKLGPDGIKNDFTNLGIDYTYMTDVANSFAAKQAAANQKGVGSNKDTPNWLIDQWTLTGIVPNANSVKETIDYDQKLKDKIDKELIPNYIKQILKQNPKVGTDQVQKILDNIGISTASVALGQYIDKKNEILNQIELPLKGGLKYLINYQNQQQEANEIYKKIPVISNIVFNSANWANNLTHAPQEGVNMLKALAFPDPTRDYRNRAFPSTDVTMPQYETTDKDGNKIMVPISQKGMGVFDEKTGTHNFNPFNWNWDVIAGTSTRLALDLAALKVPAEGVGALAKFAWGSEAGRALTLGAKLEGEGLGGGLLGSTEYGSVGWRAANLAAKGFEGITVGSLGYAMPGMLLWGPDAIRSEMEHKGIDIEQATKLGMLRSAVDGLIFSISPSDALGAGRRIVMGEIEDAMGHESYATIAETNWDIWTGKSISNTMLKALLSPKFAVRGIAKATFDLELQESTQLIANHAISQYYQKEHPDYYAPEHDLTAENMINATVSSLGTAFLLGLAHARGIAKESEYARNSALFQAANSPDFFIHQIGSRYERGEISQDEALRQQQIIKQAGAIMGSLGHEFIDVDKNDKLTSEQRRKAKYDLFINKVNNNGIVNELNDVIKKEVLVNIPEAEGVVGRQTQIGAKSSPGDISYTSEKDRLTQMLLQNTHEYQEILDRLEERKKMSPDNRLKDENLEFLERNKNLLFPNRDLTIEELDHRRRLLKDLVKNETNPYISATATSFMRQIELKMADSRYGNQARPGFAYEQLSNLRDKVADLTDQANEELSIAQRQGRSNKNTRGFINKFIEDHLTPQEFAIYDKLRQAAQNRTTIGGTLGDGKEPPAQTGATEPQNPNPPTFTPPVGESGTRKENETPSGYRLPIGGNIVMYQGGTTPFDNRKYNYFSLNSSEAGDYGPNVRAVSINTEGFLNKKLPDGNWTEEFYNMHREFEKQEGHPFDILDNSSEGLARQQRFFEFLESNGYKGYSELTGDPFQSENAYAVAFTNDFQELSQDELATLISKKDIDYIALSESDADITDTNNSGLMAIHKAVGIMVYEDEDDTNKKVVDGAHAIGYVARPARETEDGWELSGDNLDPKYEKLHSQDNFNPGKKFKVVLKDPNDSPFLLDGINQLLKNAELTTKYAIITQQQLEDLSKDPNMFREMQLHFPDDNVVTYVHTLDYMRANRVVPEFNTVDGDKVDNLYINFHAMIALRNALTGLNKDGKEITGEITKVSPGTISKSKDGKFRDIRDVIKNRDVLSPNHVVIVRKPEDLSYKGLPLINVHELNLGSAVMCVPTPDGRAFGVTLRRNDLGNEAASNIINLLRFFLDYKQAQSAGKDTTDLDAIAEQYAGLVHDPDNWDIKSFAGIKKIINNIVYASQKSSRFMDPVTRNALKDIPFIDFSEDERSIAFSFNRSFKHLGDGEKISGSDYDKMHSVGVHKQKLFVQSEDGLSEEPNPGNEFFFKQFERFLSGRKMSFRQANMSLDQPFQIPNLTRMGNKYKIDTPKTWKNVGSSYWDYFTQNLQTNTLEHSITNTNGSKEFVYMEQPTLNYTIHMPKETPPKDHLEEVYDYIDRLKAATTWEEAKKIAETEGPKYPGIEATTKYELSKKRDLMTYEEKKDEYIKKWHGHNSLSSMLRQYNKLKNDKQRNSKKGLALREDIKKLSSHLSYPFEDLKGGKLRVTSPTGSKLTHKSFPSKSLPLIEGKYVYDGTEVTIKDIENHSNTWDPTVTGLRPDFDMPIPAIKSGFTAINKGILTTPNAQGVLRAIAVWKKQGYIDLKTGKGIDVQRDYISLENYFNFEPEFRALTEEENDKYVLDYTNWWDSLSDEQKETELEAYGEARQDYEDYLTSDEGGDGEGDVQENQTEKSREEFSEIGNPYSEFGDFEPPIASIPEVPDTSDNYKLLTEVYRDLSREIKNKIGSLEDILQDKADWTEQQIIEWLKCK